MILLKIDIKYSMVYRIFDTFKDVQDAGTCGGYSFPLIDASRYVFCSDVKLNAWIVDLNKGNQAQLIYNFQKLLNLINFTELSIKGPYNLGNINNELKLFLLDGNNRFQVNVANSNGGIYNWKLSDFDSIDLKKVKCLVLSLEHKGNIKVNIHFSNLNIR